MVRGVAGECYSAQGTLFRVTYTMLAEIMLTVPNAKRDNMILCSLGGGT
jgi:hypothetical protein